MELTEGDDGLSRRASRAMALMAVALIVILVAGFAYLRPQLSGVAKTSALPPGAARSPTPPLLSDVYSAVYDFVSPSVGWALVSDQTQSPRFWVFKTTDGAKHWHSQLTGTSPSAIQGLPHMQILDRDHGFVSVGDPIEIFRTIDGGSRWTPLTFPVYISATAKFSDPQHGWIIGNAGSLLAPVSRQISTSDGGDTWKDLPQAPTFPNGGKGGNLDSNFAFRSPIEGWLGGLEAPGKPVVYSSIDGGLSWQPHHLPVDVAGVPSNGKGLAEGSDVYLIPGAGVLAVAFDPGGTIAGFTSFDGGGTWRRLPPPPGETAFSDYIFQDTFLWWAMRYGTLFKSNDAGQTWKEVAQETDEWDYVPGIIDAKHAWAHMLVVFPNTNPPHGTGLAMSSDGGIRWTPVSVPKPV